MIPKELIAQRAEAVRCFNRFYTQWIGILEGGPLRSPFSPTEARVVTELARREPVTAAVLSEVLGLDRGYLSRILSRLQKRGLLDKQASPDNARQNLLRLNAAGRLSFAALDADSLHPIEQMLVGLPAGEQEALLKAMHAIQGILGGLPERRQAYRFRPPRPGDFGWVVQRHGALYAQEYGWDEGFEALVAEIIAKYIREYDPTRDCGWIAELDGENVGSVFLVKQSASVAKLRMLIVEPQARGLGIGTRLVGDCISKARQFGYQRLTLWTMDNLLSARKIYQRVGFRIVHQEPNLSFGDGLIEETWELNLA